MSLTPSQFKGCFTYTGRHRTLYNHLSVFIQVSLGIHAAPRCLSTKLLPLEPLRIQNDFPPTFKLLAGRDTAKDERDCDKPNTGYHRTRHTSHK